MTHATEGITNSNPMIKMFSQNVNGWYFTLEIEEILQILSTLYS